jgi:hypothetical protein
MGDAWSGSLGYVNSCGSATSVRVAFTSTSISFRNAGPPLFTGVRRETV